MQRCFSYRSRTYIYLISTAPTRSAIWSRYSYHVPQPLGIWQQCMVRREAQWGCTISQPMHGQAEILVQQQCASDAVSEYAGLWREMRWPLF